MTEASVIGLLSLGININLIKIQGVIVIFRPPISGNEIEKVKIWKKKHEFLDIKAITSQIFKISLKKKYFSFKKNNSKKNFFKKKFL